MDCKQIFRNHWDNRSKISLGTCFGLDIICMTLLPMSYDQNVFPAIFGNNYSTIFNLYFSKDMCVQSWRMVILLGSAMCRSEGGIRKHAKARCHIYMLIPL